MGCGSSKATDIVVPMPDKVKSNVNKCDNGIHSEKDKDSLRGSQASLPSSTSDTTRSDRETSAKSTRTEDSGLGELEDENIITENSDPKKIEAVKATDRPVTPELTLEGTKIPRRQSPKERKVSFAQQQEDVRNRVNCLSPLGGVIERPQSRGGLAFDVILCPETGNVKRRPQHLKKLERRGKKTKRRTKEEIENKMKLAEERRKEQQQEIMEKAISSRKERQLKEAQAMDEFARRQIDNSQEMES
ncbi:predicted protein [Nematostella vectensis]|uniref:Uncharacterized protein n=1 Tax=Nematostella vectensis TaxID=45351 RepID=A7RV69_NEMVE|nr:vicilin-like seed storage protein At2g18540 [Nematostella vectensis]EDO44523.1 predicted protein [Nematostella vectensis]|eukprot:XP_001636586.1 predicted protein [Nematostella vectensis]